MFAGYITCILDDAKIYANHAKKKVIDLDDVKLASQMTMEKAFTSPPPREVSLLQTNGRLKWHWLKILWILYTQVLLELARSKNMAALPLIKPHCGLRLPPDRHCLLSANYKLRAAEIQPKKMTKSALERATGKNKSIGATILKRQTIATIPKTQTVTIPKPVFKFSGNSNAKLSAGTTTTPSATSSSSASVQPAGGVAASAVAPPKVVQEVKMELDEEFNSNDPKGLKRKHEDDDEFEMVE